MNYLEQSASIRRIRLIRVPSRARAHRTRSPLKSTGRSSSTGRVGPGGAEAGEGERRDGADDARQVARVRRRVVVAVEELDDREAQQAARDGAAGGGGEAAVTRAARADERHRAARRERRARPTTDQRDVRRVRILDA